MGALGHLRRRAGAEIQVDPHLRRDVCQLGVAVDGKPVVAGLEVEHAPVHVAPGHHPAQMHPGRMGAGADRHVVERDMRLQRQVRHAQMRGHGPGGVARLDRLAVEQMQPGMAQRAQQVGQRPGQVGVDGGELVADGEAGDADMAVPEPDATRTI